MTSKFWSRYGNTYNMTKTDTQQTRDNHVLKWLHKIIELNNTRKNKTKQKKKKKKKQRNKQTNKKTQTES